MTSVQSHPLRLSGNSGLLYLWVLAVCLSSCGIFGPASKQTATQTKHVEDSEVDSTSFKVDTIRWTTVSEEVVPPITSRGPSSATTFKERYKVVLLAPFNASHAQMTSHRFSGRMLKMLEFYVGVRYALDFLVHDVAIDFSILDTEGTASFDREFREFPDVQEADIIIGPYFTENLEAVAKFAAEKGKILLSPWNTTPLVHENPFYVQMRPSLELHASELMTFARSKFAADKIMLLTKNAPRDTAVLAYFQDANNAFSQSTLQQIPELLVDDIGDPLLSEHITTMMLEDSMQSFIIPVWYDEPFVIAALAKLNYAKADQNLTVFGLPQWMEMKKMDYDYYDNLDVHVSSTKPANYGQPQDRQLRSYFFERFGTLPGNDAFYGKDLMMWLTYLLQHYGTIISDGFGKGNDASSTQKFEIGTVYGDDGETIDFYQNRQIQILRFKDYRFQSIGQIPRK